jgi:hypothetical protein
MPPYPFFRPALRELENNPDSFADPETADDLQEYIKKIAFSLERQLKVNVTAERGSGRSPGVNPEHPQVDTGTLRNSIEARRE